MTQYPTCPDRRYCPKCDIQMIRINRQKPDYSYYQCPKCGKTVKIEKEAKLA